MADWERIQSEYITTNVSFRELERRYGVSRNSIGKRAREEQWGVLRAEYRAGADSPGMPGDSEAGAAESTGHGAAVPAQGGALPSAPGNDTERVREAANTDQPRHALAVGPADAVRLELAAEGVLGLVEKTLAAGEALDVRALRYLCATLKDIRELLNLRADADIREQEAKIENLRRQAQKEDKSSAVTVVLEGVVRDYAK